MSHLDSEDSRSSHFNESITKSEAELPNILEFDSFQEDQKNVVVCSGSDNFNAVHIKLEVNDEEQGPSLVSSAPTSSNDTSERNIVSAAVDEDDGLREFFDSLAKTVKTFPPALRAKVKAKVFQIVNDAEMSLYT